ncbi:phage head-tail joining protein [Aliamphritea hakodatensis]|uniref:phage head-tail joining protein n=1 Tax=Aliamphritea hakodatensis TaxID=2895352 RepID=UPI0022FD7BBB|nr:gpW family head-tail joining protein [Aliamphritea hakodatensis]
MATQEQLNEALAAKHQLLMGKRAVKIQKDGRMVEYTPASLADLERYILHLQQQLGQVSLRRPLGVFL